MIGVSVYLKIGSCHNLRERGRAPPDQREAGSVFQAVKVVPGEGQVRAVTTGVTLAELFEPPETNAKHYCSLKF